MATAEEYATWIVNNSDKKGTPEFDTVAQAYQIARGVGTAAPPTPEPPGNLAVAGQAAIKGLAGIPDMFLNVPQNLANLGKAAYGTAAGVLGRPDIPAGMQITPPPNYVQQGLQSLGAINPAYEPQSFGQRVLGTAIQGGVGMLANPAAGLRQVAQNIGTGLVGGTAGEVTREATGSPLAALAAGALTPWGVQKAGMMAQSTMAQAATAKSAAALRDQTLADAQAAGYVLPPSRVNPSFVNTKLESIGGKAAVQQEAAIRNQAVTNRLAAGEVGLPANEPITVGALEKVRENAGKVYEEVNALNPGGELQRLRVKTLKEQPELPGVTTGLDVNVKKVPGTKERVITSDILDEQGRPIVKSVIPATPSKLSRLRIRETTEGTPREGPLLGMAAAVKETRGGNPLEQLRQWRADANMYYRHYEVSADPKSLGKARVLSAKAKAIEDDFERLALASPDPTLLDRFTAARTLIAKTYDVERALNVGNGNVDAQILGRALDKGKPLTGNLAIMARFAQAFPSVTREASKVPAPGVSATEAGMGAGLGTVGYLALHGPAGIALGALPLVRGPARSAVLSGPYQRHMLTPGVGLSTRLGATIQPQTGLHTALQSALLGRPILQPNAMMQP